MEAYQGTQLATRVLEQPDQAATTTEPRLTPVRGSGLKGARQAPPWPRRRQ